MSQQVATIEQPPKLPTIQAGGAVRAIVPQDFDSAWRIANAVTKAGMAPKGLESAERAMVAILHGLEVGLTPMNALQSIAVVNGRPTIWGDGAIGLVRASGLAEFIDETIVAEKVGDGTQLVAICRAKRKNEPVIERRFSQADAVAAGLWGKAGPWTQYPKRMLQLRARAFALRDGWADVLKGLGIKEEVDDISPMRDVTPPPAPPAPPTVPAVTDGTKHDADGVVWEDEPQGEAPAVPPSPPSVPSPPSPPTPPSAGNDPGPLPEFLKREKVPFDSAAWRERAMAALAECEHGSDLFEAERTIILPDKHKATTGDRKAVEKERARLLDSFRDDDRPNSTILDAG